MMTSKLAILTTNLNISHNYSIRGTYVVFDDVAEIALLEEVVSNLVDAVVCSGAVGT